MSDERKAVIWPAGSELPIFQNAPPPQAKLWRYLTFAKFAALLESTKLHFTRVDQFDDHFEGAWPKDDLGSWKRRGWDPDMLARATDDARKCFFVSCWVESEYESAAMWRLYASGDEGVAIATTFGKLNEVVCNFNKPPFRFGGAARVRYIDHFTDGLVKEIQAGEPMPDASWAWRPFMLKNRSYEHEREVRALIGPFDGVDGFEIPIRIAEFIDEIRVSPFAKNWFMQTVNGLANRYGLSGSKVSSLSPDAFYMKPP